MDHAIDRLSRKLAEATSRRAALGVFLRSLPGAFLLSAGFGASRVQAQAIPCTACGTCQAVDFASGKVGECANSCEARVLCRKAQSSDSYGVLAAGLVSLGYTPSSYSALVATGIYNGTTYVLDVTYVNTNPDGITAQLSAVWAPGLKVNCYAMTLDATGTPLNAYTVNSSGKIEIVIPTFPSPFVVSVSPDSVSVDQGSSSTAAVSVTVNNPFRSRIAFQAVGLPSGASATFDPPSIAAPGTGSTTMTIAAAGTTSLGTYAVTIVATGSGVSESASISVVVTASGSESYISRPIPNSSLDTIPQTTSTNSATNCGELCSSYCSVLVGIGGGAICAGLGKVICSRSGLVAPLCALGFIIGCPAVGLKLQEVCKYNCYNAKCSPLVGCEILCPECAACGDVGCFYPFGSLCCLSGEYVCVVGLGEGICCADGECCNGPEGCVPCNS